MNSMTKFIFVALALAGIPAPAVFADGEGCSASATKISDGMLRKAEEAEKSGRTKDAYKAATQPIPSIECAGNGYKRRDGVVERTSKKLGAEAEKAGRFGEAFEYYSKPYSNRVDYPLADADRAMLKHAKAKPDDYKVVSGAASYFTRREISSSLKEVRAIAMRGGDKLLVQEEKIFASNRRSFDTLQQAKDWLDVNGEAKRANARADQRGDSLLADGTFSSVELAFQYYNFSENKGKLKKAEERARKLGDEHSRKGENKTAVKFYELAGDSAKAEGLAKKAEAEGEKAEAKRQDKFKKDQKSLEKELGL